MFVKAVEPLIMRMGELVYEDLYPCLFPMMKFIPACVVVNVERIVVCQCSA
jgi:hypothetical protein